MAHSMRLLLLLALVYLTGAQETGVTISLADESMNGIVQSVRSMSVILRLPPCGLAGETIAVKVTNITGQEIQQPNFTMPVCRFRRELIALEANIDGFQRMFNLGYQVTGLKENTKYNMSYEVGNRKSNQLEISTIMPINYKDIDTGFGRSGAMVVITVLLAIAMAVLIGLFIVAVIIRK
ncbi:uroplakin-2 [Hypanus sabinus]|uniref:uroplakin-2 n=1 Tax=Hypanus sabinus TaxID=79690 RepID=UPI0028C3C7AB|nr:uroplakin-2 [Hypanus sabinus]